MLNLDHIRAVIAEGDVKEALNELLKLLETSDRKTRKLRDGVIILHSKYQDLSRKEALGLIEADDALREKGQINDGLLSLITDIEISTGPAPLVETVSAPGQQRKWLWLLLLIPLGLVAVFWKQIAGKDKPTAEPAPAVEEKRVDITIESWTISPEPVVTDRPAAIHFDVKNAGSVDVAYVEVEWWAMITEPRPTQTWVIDFLKSGGKKSFDFRYTWKTGSPAPVTARVRVDPNRKIAKDDLTNNLWEKQVYLKPPQVPRRSELAIVDYRWQPNPVVKLRPVELYIDIVNNGPDTAKSIPVEWYDNTANRTATQTWIIAALPPGQKHRIKFMHSWSDNLGDAVVTKVLLDPQNDIQDNNRQNNSVLTRMRLITAATNLVTNCDLWVRGWEYRPNPIVRGQNTDIKVDIVNEGPGNARDFFVYWYASASDRQPTQKWHVDQLGAGERKSFAFQHIWLRNTATPLRMKVVIDPERKTKDINTSNNKREGQVRVR